MIPFIEIERLIDNVQLAAMQWAYESPAPLIGGDLIPKGDEPIALQTARSELRQVIHKRSEAKELLEEIIEIMEGLK